MNMQHEMVIVTRLDDPLDAVAVHGGGGVVGLLAVPFFMSVNLEVQSRNDSCWLLQ